MKLHSLVIHNFRGLKEIEVEFKEPISVIVGPNAVGKTSVLEAIRLVKGLLVPRSIQETTLLLQDMGAFSQNLHLLDLPSIVGDTTCQLEIILTFEPTEEELKITKQLFAQLVLLRVRDQSAISSSEDDLALTQFLSSPQGQQVYQSAEQQCAEELEQLAQKNRLTLHLLIDPGQKLIRGKDLFSQEVFRVLEQRLSPALCLLSYFPADRSMPAGETTIQVGSADSANQMHSHLTQPSLKYSRLKNFIVNQILLGEEARNQLAADFALIFDTLLVGKRLQELTVNPIGTLSVKIQEVASGAIYDIDRMSSGEKGMILQFLLMRRSLTAGGLLLIDEPELHLNPAICRQLLPFIIDKVIQPLQLQGLICTHSPEILADAFDRADCGLFHLRSGSDISPVYPQDKAEVFEALRRLGASTSDVLFSRGTIFVEGSDDVELLEAGFAGRLSGFKVKALGGRQEIEKEIQKLQESERAGKLESPQVFIFDRDRKPAGFTNTSLVKTLQWDRYCFENYLLDPDIIFDVCQTIRCKNPPESRGATRTKLKSLAMSEIQVVVAREIYKKREPDNPGFRAKEVGALSDYKYIASSLAERLSCIKESLKDFEVKRWIADFEEEATRLDGTLRTEWEGNWQRECNGKRLIEDFHRSVCPALSIVEFKKRIMNELTLKQGENWHIVDNLLGQVVP